MIDLMSLIRNPAHVDALMSHIEERSTSDRKGIRYRNFAPQRVGLRI